MSDSIEELSKAYRRNVSMDHRRRIGLFPIPEVPEDPGMWSTVVDVVLTSLRYLAPATLLTLLWGQNSLLYKLLKYIDSAFRSVVYSCDEQKQTVLQWLETAGTVRVDKLETVWRHGWIVCGVLDIAIPGTCAGHPPTKLSLKHAQSIAEEYLGVEPVFTTQELESIDTLGKHHEWKLITFLDNIREALIKITPPPKPSPIRFAAESTHHTFDYIAKGSGLVAAQIKNKAFFKIYPTAQQSLNPGVINIEIKGPNKSHGTFTLPAVLGKAQVIRQSLLGRKATTNYTENILPLTQGASYLRNFGKNDMSKTYFIPKLKSNIDIDSETNDDHVKIGYTVEYEGKYEISITSKNLNIAGSPFSMVASKDIVETLENDNFTLEDGEEIDIVDVSTDKKAVIRIVDFVTEKMLLKEDGCLQKISTDEAKQLMEACNKDNSIIDNDKEQVILTANTDIRSKKALKLFYVASRKIIIMLRVSKCFWDYKGILKTEKMTESRLRNQDIPDVVNSTLNEYHVNTGFVPTVSDRYIIPKPISVSLKTEKLNESLENEPESKKVDMDSYGPLYENIFDDDTQNSSNNPFTVDTFVQSYTTEKKLGSFITTEYEANNSHSEELQNQSITLVNKESDGNQITNPFTEIKKIDFSKSDCNSNVKKSHNPFDETKYEDFYTSENQTEFIIGAPVSLPPNLVTTSIDSINTVASNTSSDTASCDKPETNNNITQNSTQLLDEKNLNNSNFTTMSPNKDMWDSAYVSIDDNNSSEVTASECVEETSYKLKQVLIADKTPTTESLRERLLHDIRERSNFNDNENSKKKIYESKKSAFSPIHEENDKYETHVSTKSDLMTKSETDSVTEAFAELDDIYDDYFSKEEDNTDKNLQTLSISINHTKECDTLVDSASEKVSDVKRQTTTSEGRTSEIQANVTESVSASQILHMEMAIEENSNRRRSGEIQFGDKIYNNIVIEKKLYWDEKIRQIQAKEQELKSLKRRISSKYLRRNDSLTKKRGKKIVKNFLNSAEKETGNDNWNTNLEPTYDDCSHERSHNKAKLKDSLRNYWDSKVQAMDSCFGKKSEKVIEYTKEVPHVNTEKAVSECKGHDLDKQDLPEKMFEAFETSPKRFFGTSRQQILNKIDTYLGKYEQEDEIKSVNSEISHDSGLVSSRISLFHNIAETESAPSPFRKHKSLNNICTEKVSMHNKNYNSHEHQNLLDTDNNESTSSKIGNVDKFDKNSNLIKEPIVSFQVKKLEGNENMKNDNIIVDTPVDIVQDNENYNFNENAAKRNDHVETDQNNFDQSSEILDTDDYKHNNRKGSLLRNNLNSFSKSEMDIFSKTSKTVDIDLDIHKSFEELPKNSVKKFISLYEDVSKSSDQTNLIGSCKKNRKILGNIRNESSTGGTAREPQSETQVRKEVEHRKKTKTLLNDNRFESDNTTGSGYEVISIENKHTCHLSLSDIDIEIIENPENTTDTDKSVPEDYVDYKNRFKKATQFFKSLEELRIDKKPNEVKENVIAITDIPEESVDKKDEKKKVKKCNIKKSHTMPSSELSKIWNQMQEKNTLSPKRLMKISEKFNVEDLYEDVMEGRLSRQGSLRGIPNKKAVLETFRSMENMTQNFNSYEFATSQTGDFEKVNRTRHAQTYLSEYPYLPTTDPSKFHSRLDASASGLITFKELKELKHNKKYRRNSVPNGSINPIFTENL